MLLYQAPILKSLLSFYGEHLYPKTGDSIFSHLDRIAKKMYDGLIHNEDCVYVEINNYHPDYLGVPANKLKEIDFDIASCQHTIAREFSFASWEEVINLNETKYYLDFEQCVNSVVTGDFEQLKSLILKYPLLIHCRSQYGHDATLLHYTASNGVELWRQQVPQNLDKITKFLLDNGADKNATMNVYGGQFTTLQLLETSAHPYNAGIAQTMIEILK